MPSASSQTFHIQSRNASSSGRSTGTRAPKVCTYPNPIPAQFRSLEIKQLTRKRQHRCFPHHPRPLRSGFLLTIPGSLLGTAKGQLVELHPQEFLHLVVDLYTFPYAASLLADSREGKGVVSRGVLPWGIGHKCSYRNSHIRRR
jgi:hypothetical protein